MGWGGVAGTEKQGAGEQNENRLELGARHFVDLASRHSISSKIRGTVGAVTKTESWETNTHKN